MKMNVADGAIQEIKIFGDFFGLGEIKDVEDILTGVKYDKASLEEAIDQIDVKNTLAISKRRFAWVNLLKRQPFQTVVFF